MHCENTFKPFQHHIDQLKSKKKNFHITHWAQQRGKESTHHKKTSSQQNKKRLLLVLMEEILGTTWVVWNPSNNGINYQPQLVIAGFLPSTVFRLWKKHPSMQKLTSQRPWPVPIPKVQQISLRNTNLGKSKEITWGAPLGGSFPVDVCS